MRLDKGFTLIELAIVLVIIGLLIGSVIKGVAFIDSAKVQDATKIAMDLAQASTAFKDRFNYLPGDLPLAGNDIPGIDPACSLAIATAGIGNGAIDSATEITCANTELLATGFIKGDMKTYFGNVWLASYAMASGANTPCSNGSVDSTAPIPRSKNVVLMGAIPVEQAQQIDIKTDDGVFNTGQVRASATYASAKGTLVCVSLPI